MLAGRLTRGLASHDGGHTRDSVSAPTTPRPVPGTSTAGWGTERSAGTAMPMTPPVGVPPEPSLIPGGTAVPPGTGAGGPGAIRTAGSARMTDQPVSPSFAGPAPSAGNAGDIRR
jgi:hypothetical protein